MASCPQDWVHFSNRCFFMQAILWQVVDAKLQSIRKQFSADLTAFWDARTIYQAQLEAHQVFWMPCNTRTSHAL